jgi:prepilin-type N-terminal cleavage/methylation domain-containing protein
VNCYNYKEALEMKKGFTLAEVLVTLGIIGVVSAMTVPTLMQNYQRKSYVTQLHKVYNEISQASQQYITDRNAINLTEAGLNSQDTTNNFIEKYFKIVQKCENSFTPCFAPANEFRVLTGATGTVGHTVQNSYVLASGAAIRLDYYAHAISVLVDINGAKSPNIIGRDIFYMELYPNVCIDDFNNDTGAKCPLSKDDRETQFSKCQNGTSAWGCFGKILNDNWEMSY